MASNPYKTVLQYAVEVLREDAEDHRGDIGVQVAWHALKVIKEIAEDMDVPLSEIGLEGYDPDELLCKKP